MKDVFHLLLQKSQQIIEPIIFNPLLVADKYYWELSHSKILEYIVNLNSDYLRYFLETITESTKIMNPDTIGELWNVNREYRKIDLLFTNDQKQIAIIIENKIHADDQDKQLYRYFNEPALNMYQRHIFYLTLLGSAPSSKSLHNLSIDNIKLLSYSEHIHNFIVKCINVTQDNDILVGLKEYLEDINMMTVEERRKKEIVDLVFEQQGVNRNDIAFLNAAGLRYCHYIFINELSNMFKNKNIVCDWSDLNEFKTSYEYGLRAPLIEKEIEFWICFDNDDKRKGDLFIGLKKLENNDLSKIVKKNYKLTKESSNEYWYYWAYSKEIDNLGDFTNRSISSYDLNDWKQYAHEAYPVLLNQYNNAKKIFLTTGST